MSKEKENQPHTAHAHTLHIDQQQAIAQLEILGYQQGVDIIYPRVIVPDSDPRKGTFAQARNLTGLKWAEIERFNQDGYGIYFVINGGGHADKDVKICRAIFCEFDDRPIEDQISFWQDLGLPEPTMQIATRKSVHTYWVFEEPIPVEQWRVLQAALLAYTGSDQSLKNPSRVMRLAGAYHIKPGCTPVRCDIIHQSGKRYSYSELRAAIPVSPLEPVVQPKLSPLPRVNPQFQIQSAVPKDRRYEDIEVPVPKEVPLEVCLGKESRALLESGVSEGGRNNGGAKLARDLIGTANHLQSIGQRFDGDPRQLLDEYASHCTPPMDAKEVEAIWKSASKDRPGPSCKAEGVLACIRGWYWNHYVKPNQPNAEHDSDRSSRPSKPSVVTRVNKKPGGFDPEKTPDDWEAFTAQVIAADIITNPKQRIFTLKRLAGHWKVPVAFIESVLSDLHTPKPGEEKPKYYTLNQFLNQASSVQDWIVPGLVYRGGLFILSGRSKIGKSLLFTDITMAGMEGGSLGDMCSVKPLKILVVTTDEGTHETIDKLIKRGFDDLENCDDRLRFITAESGVSMSNLQPLEEQLEDFHPDLVLMDSLRTLSRYSAVSENEAAFGKPLKQVKDLMERYNAGCILIHHDTKDPLMNGVDCLSGSTAIASHSSGWMRMIAQNPKDERDPHRILIVGNSRGGDPFRYLLKINPDGKWIDSGCFEYLGEIGDDGAADTKAMLDRVIAFLNRNRGTRYAATELHNLLGGNMDTLFRALSKGVKMELICRRKEAREFRRVRGRRPWLYFLPDSDVGDGDNPGESYPPQPGNSHTYIPGAQNSFQKIDDDSPNIDPASDRISGTDSGIISVMPQVPENIPVKTLPIPEIQNSATQSNPAIFGTDSHVDGEVCLTEEMKAILELMQSVYTAGDMQALDEEVVQLGITPEQKQLIWGRLDKETQLRLQGLHRHLLQERSSATTGWGFGALAPLATKPLATIFRATLTQTQASTESLASLAQAKTEEPATQSTELALHIQVGSRVYWDNCPGHFASWNPFTVTAIEGDSARLDFVAVLVPVAELRRVE